MPDGSLIRWGDMDPMLIFRLYPLPPQDDSYVSWRKTDDVLQHLTAPVTKVPHPIKGDYRPRCRPRQRRQLLQRVIQKWESKKKVSEPPAVKNILLHAMEILQMSRDAS